MSIVKMFQLLTTCITFFLAYTIILSQYVPNIQGFCKVIVFFKCNTMVLHCSDHRLSNNHRWRVQMEKKTRFIILIDYRDASHRLIINIKHDYAKKFSVHITLFALILPLMVMKLLSSKESRL